MTLREHVLQQALALPPGDQTYFALALKNHLRDSIDPETEELEGLHCDELLAELRRCSAAYQAGTMTARDADDVIADLRRRQG